MSPARTDPQPPKPPEIGREFQVKPVQAIGVLLLALFVLFGLVGFFGTTRVETDRQQSTVTLEVTYPSRTRYKRTDSISAEVTNTGREALPGVVLEFDREYIESFSAVTFTPGISTIANGAYVVELGDLPAGQTRTVEVSVQAEKYWRQRGTVVAEVNGSAVEVELSTLVFP